MQKFTDADLSPSDVLDFEVKPFHLTLSILLRLCARLHEASHNNLSRVDASPTALADQMEYDEIVNTLGNTILELFAYSSGSTLLEPSCNELLSVLYPRLCWSKLGRYVYSYCLQLMLSCVNSPCLERHISELPQHLEVLTSMESSKIAVDASLGLILSLYISTFSHRSFSFRRLFELTNHMALFLTYPNHRLFAYNGPTLAVALQRRIALLNAGYMITELDTVPIVVSNNTGDIHIDPVASGCSDSSLSILSSASPKSPRSQFTIPSKSSHHLSKTVASAGDFSSRDTTPHTQHTSTLQGNSPSESVPPSISSAAKSTVLQLIHMYLDYKEHETNPWSCIPTLASISISSDGKWVTSDDDDDGDGDVSLRSHSNVLTTTPTTAVPAKESAAAIATTTPGRNPMILRRRHVASTKARRSASPGFVLPSSPMHQYSIVSLRSPTTSSLHAHTDTPLGSGRASTHQRSVPATLLSPRRHNGVSYALGISSPTTSLEYVSSSASSRTATTHRRLSKPLPRIIHIPIIRSKYYASRTNIYNAYLCLELGMYSDMLNAFLLAHNSTGTAFTPSDGVQLASMLVRLGLYTYAYLILSLCKLSSSTDRSIGLYLQYLITSHLDASAAAPQTALLRGFRGYTPLASTILTTFAKLSSTYQTFHQYAIKQLESLTSIDSSQHLLQFYQQHSSLLLSQPYSPTDGVLHMAITRLIPPALLNDYTTGTQPIAQTVTSLSLTHSGASQSRSPPVVHSIGGGGSGGGLYAHGHPSSQQSHHRALSSTHETQVPHSLYLTKLVHYDSLLHSYSRNAYSARDRFHPLYILSNLEVKYALNHDKTTQSLGIFQPDIDRAYGLISPIHVTFEKANELIKYTSSRMASRLYYQHGVSLAYNLTNTHHEILESHLLLTAKHADPVLPTTTRVRPCFFAPSTLPCDPTTTTLLHDRFSSLYPNHPLSVFRAYESILADFIYTAGLHDHQWQHAKHQLSPYIPLVAQTTAGVSSWYRLPPKHFAHPTTSTKSQQTPWSQAVSSLLDEAYPTRIHHTASSPVYFYAAFEQLELALAFHDSKSAHMAAVRLMACLPRLIEKQSAHAYPSSILQKAVLHLAQYFSSTAHGLSAYKLLHLTTNTHHNSSHGHLPALFQPWDDHFHNTNIFHATMHQYSDYSFPIARPPLSLRTISQSLTPNDRVILSFNLLAELFADKANISTSLTDSMTMECASVNPQSDSTMLGLFLACVSGMPCAQSVVQYTTVGGLVPQASTRHVYVFALITSLLDHIAQVSCSTSQQFLHPLTTSSQSGLASSTSPAKESAQPGINTETVAVLRLALLLCFVLLSIGDHQTALNLANRIHVDLLSLSSFPAFQHRRSLYGSRISSSVLHERSESDQHPAKDLPIELIYDDLRAIGILSCSAPLHADVSRPCGAKMVIDPDHTTEYTQYDELFMLLLLTRAVSLLSTHSIPSPSSPAVPGSNHHHQRAAPDSILVACLHTCYQYGLYTSLYHYSEVAAYLIARVYAQHDDSSTRDYWALKYLTLSWMVATPRYLPQQLSGLDTRQRTSMYDTITTTGGAYDVLALPTTTSKPDGSTLDDSPDPNEVDTCDGEDDDSDSAEFGGLFGHVDFPLDGIDMYDVAYAFNHDGGMCHTQSIGAYY